MVATLDQATEQFYEKLRQETQHLNPVTTRFGSGYILTASRQLTMEEFENVLALAIKHQLPIGLDDDYSGFDFAVVIYRHPESHGEALTEIYRLLANNIPEEVQQQWRTENYDQKMDAKMAYFQPMIWDEQNLALLKHYGIELRDPSQYRY